MVFKGRRSQQKVAKWQKKVDECESSLIEPDPLPNSSQVHSCSYLEALMREKAGESTFHGDEASVVVEQCYEIELWSQTDSTKLSWADMSEPSEVEGRSQTDDADLLEGRSQDDDSADFPEQCLSFSYPVRTPTPSIASDEEFGNVDPRFTMSMSTCTPHAEIHWESMELCMPTSVACWDTSMCDFSGVQPPCYETTGYEMALPHNKFDQRVCEAKAAAQEHERALQQGQDTTSASSQNQTPALTEQEEVIVEGTVTVSTIAEREVSEVLYYLQSDENCQTALADINAGIAEDMAMQNDWTTSMQMFVPVLVPAFTPDYDAEGLQHSVEQVLPCRRSLSKMDYPSEFGKAVAESSFKVSESCSHSADAETMSRATDESETTNDLSSANCQDSSDGSCSHVYTEAVESPLMANFADVHDSSMMEFSGEIAFGDFEVNQPENCWYSVAYNPSTGCIMWPMVSCDDTCALDCSDQYWPENGLEENADEAEFYEWLDKQLPSASSKDISHNNVPRYVDWLEQCEEPEEVTTFMIHNVPNEYTRTILIEHMDNIGLYGKFDLIYLPIDRETKQNVGYAFVNFVDAKAAEEGVNLLLSCEMNRLRRRVPKPNHQKVWISQAHLQGLQKNVDHYRKTSSKPLVRINGKWTDVLPLSVAD